MDQGASILRWGGWDPRTILVKGERSRKKACGCMDRVRRRRIKMGVNMGIFMMLGDRCDLVAGSENISYRISPSDGNLLH